MSSRMRLGADNGSRTRMLGLEGRCSTVELHPHAARSYHRAKVTGKGDHKQNRTNDESNSSHAAPSFPAL